MKTPKHSSFALLVAGLIALCLAAPALAQSQRNLAVTGKGATEQRVALVIGNAAYKESPLRNPVNDARAIAAKLKGLGFDVIVRENLLQKQLGAALREFRARLKPGGVALFFYAGHGVQVKGINYLPVVDAEIASEEDVSTQSLDVNKVLELMDEAKTRLNLVFLDACRNNPYARSFRSAADGLAKVNAPSGTIISFATRPGSVAADAGSGRNGLYTEHLLAAMDLPGQPIEQALKRVVSGVKQASKGRQEPWMEGSIEGDFYFRPGTAAVAAAAPTPGVAAPASDPAAIELLFWESIKDSKDAGELKTYLEQYPSGRFAALARARLKSLEAAPPAQVAIAAPSTQATVPTALQGDLQRLAAGEQFIPMLSDRVGPYAAGGTGFAGGYIDYLDMLNKRDGGIGGVKLTWEECETEYKNDRGVECYERLKKKGPTGATVFTPRSTGIIYSILERATADKVPVISMGLGRTDASDGRVFPYIFPLVTNYWSQSTAKIKFIGQREGGMDKLKGKKIVNLYHGSAYGKETIPVLDIQARKYGFEVTHIEVAHPGNEQRSQWLQIRQINPDWVILRGWGVMNPTALKTAQKVGFPADKILGVWWSGAEEDVLPAGDAAKGYIATTFHPSGTDFPVIQDILKYVYGGGKKGNMEDRKRIGTQYYNRGVIQGILTAEAIRAAQEKFGKKPLTGEEVRWGIENIKLGEERLKQLGAYHLLQPIKVSCLDHEGGGAVKFQQWDGHNWVLISDWIASDQNIVRPIIEESAAKYAKEKGITQRVCTG